MAEPRVSITGLPLHLVADILASLDSLEDLFSAILSNTIFNAAFAEHRRSIIAKVLCNRITPTLVPYMVILLKSFRIPPERRIMPTPTFIGDYAKVLSRPAEAIASLKTLRDRDVGYMNNNFNAIDFLCREFARDRLDPLQRKWGFAHAEGLSPGEFFRVRRAFIRYQIVLNWAWPHQYFGFLHEALSRGFGQYHSPWVNKQLLAVNSYLEKRVSEAFREVAAHDVYWGTQRIPWCSWTVERGYQMVFLNQGLPWLRRFCEGRGYDHWIKFLHPDVGLPRTHHQHPSSLLASLNLDGPGYLLQLGIPVDEVQKPLENVSEPSLSLLCGPLDEPEDGLSSDSFRMWRAAHRNVDMVSAAGIGSDLRIKNSSYVVWDYAPGDHALLQTRLDESHERRRRRLQVHSGSGETAFQLYMLDKQRCDIWQRGGRGHWAAGASGFWDKGEFDRVQGLSKEDMRFLRRKWKKDRRDYRR